ncbi:MAG: DUF2314 domain-containing protein [Pirellulales bacterium]
MAESKVFLFDGEDPEMLQASAKARATFRYFWRELHWESRRIIPGLSLACVKAPFSDGDDAPPSDDHPSVEQMWVSDIRFDGRDVIGNLLNSPNWITSVQEGDLSVMPLAEISDWMYAIGDDVYGAFTVNLMRARMSARERREHDAAWGLEFGDPKTIRVIPADFPSHGEHPMSENMAPSFRDELKKQPSMLNSKDDDGWTLLHREALGGNLATVRVLLEYGADRNAKTPHGMTPLQLAKSLGWDKVATLLSAGSMR